MGVFTQLHISWQDFDSHMACCAVPLAAPAELFETQTRKRKYVRPTSKFETCTHDRKILSYCDLWPWILTLTFEPIEYTYSTPYLCFNIIKSRPSPQHSASRDNTTNDDESTTNRTSGVWATCMYFVDRD